MKMKEPERSLNDIKKRQDVFLWTGGMAFIIILVGIMFGLGSYRDWHAPSGYVHNITQTSQGRFLNEPFIDEPGVKGRYGAKPAARWYYWKLRPDKVTWYTQLIPWLGYVFHQVLVWSVTFIAQHSKNDLKFSEKYASRLSKWNITSFILNVIFHVLHLVQTHVTYDGLAQTTSIASSQGSVVMATALIILMEYRNRGLFFGWPSLHNTDKLSEKLKLNYDPVILIRKYHGYAFAWAAVYTFWYHPMENTWGHALGFCHTWMIMLQGSLMFTKFHLNRYWRLLLETWVCLHAAVVAFQTGGPDLKGTSLWPMHLFGFAMVLVLSQIFLLPFWFKIHVTFRLVPVAVYFAVVLYMYSWIPDKDGRAWVRLPEVLSIPGTYYLFFFFSWTLLFVFIKVYRKLQVNDGKTAPSFLSKFLAIIVFCGTYLICIAVSILEQWYDVKWTLIALMLMLVTVFTTGVSISSVFLGNLVPLTKDFERYHDGAVMKCKLDRNDKPQLVTKM